MTYVVALWFLLTAQITTHFFLSLSPLLGPPITLLFVVHLISPCIKLGTFFLLWVVGCYHKAETYWCEEGIIGPEQHKPN